MAHADRPAGTTGVVKAKCKWVDEKEVESEELTTTLSQSQ